MNFKNISDKVINNIINIEVDVTSSRKFAQIILTKRHINGPEKWFPISKKKFFYNYFRSGISIDDISILTEIKKLDILKDVKDYSLLLYMINLPIWTVKQKEKYFSLLKIKIDPFLRVFSAKSKKLKVNVSDLLEINYDDKLILKSKMDKVLYYIVKAVYIDKIVDSRKSIEDVPSLLELINNQDKKIKDISTNEHPDNRVNKNNIDNIENINDKKDLKVDIEDDSYDDNDFLKIH